LCLIGRSKIYLLQEAIDTAIAHLNKALAIAEQLKIISLRSEIHQLLSATYEKNEEFSKALYHHKLFNNLQQEILSNEKVNQLKHQQIAFSIETAEKEAEIHMLKHIELKNAFDKIAIQHHELEIKNKEITDSLDYAKYIQDAYFPSTELFSKLLPDAFLLYKPKDIVSGDFYWFHQLPPVYKAERANNTQTLDRTNENFDSSNNLIQSEGTLLIAAADATGHGVPGAIMSVISCNALNEVVKKGAVYQPDLILNQVRDSIIGAFEQHGNYSARKDGMDIALVSLSPFPLVGNSSRLQFAGAYNPLWIIKKGKPTAESVVTFKTESHYLIEVRADRQPIGMYERMEPFTLHETIVNKGDTIYMFSDGYADQFGGREGEKFKTKALKELLLHIQGNTMREQQAILLNVFNDWKNGIEQVDDVCVIGIRI
jgi:serine phosphatase RsbU (regulator of sigma subunit)